MWANIQPLHQSIKGNAYDQAFWVKLFKSYFTLLLKNTQPNITLLTSEEFQDNSHSHAKIPYIEHSGTMVLAMYTS